MADGSRKIERKVEIGEERENGLIAKEEEIEDLITEDANEDEDEEQEERFNFYEEEEEEEEEEIDEELNKKCEEFIRKMKEGIKFESQQVIVL